jgi:DNA-binding transcriptional MerR regulator
MEWSIQEIARMAGTTSRALRHYGQVGLLHATRTGANGYRYYNAEALTRLQRILLLRELGLGLPAIAEVLAVQEGEAAALSTHLRWLQQEKERLDRQIRSVESTITRLERKEPLMAEEMFDGFDHTQYREEVQQRWGEPAYAAGDNWWRLMGAAERTEWSARHKAIAGRWAAAATRGVEPDGDEAQQLAQEHIEWLAAIPGTPGFGEGGLTREYVVGLGELYVADDRFAANYGGVRGASLVRDALRHYAETHL